MQTILHVWLPITKPTQRQWALHSTPLFSKQDASSQCSNAGSHELCVDQRKTKLSCYLHQVNCYSALFNVHQCKSACNNSSVIIYFVVHIHFCAYSMLHHLTQMISNLLWEVIWAVAMADTDKNWPCRCWWRNKTVCLCVFQPPVKGELL